MKVVLDANVIIAAFAARGLCHSVFEICLDHHRLVLSRELLREIGENLRIKIKVPAPAVQAILAFLRNHAEIQTPRKLRADACRDPDDVHVLGLGVSAGADVIVSGDRDLLVLRTFRTIPILSPRDFWKRVRGKR